MAAFEALEYVEAWCVFDGQRYGKTRRYVAIIDADGDFDAEESDDHEIDGERPPDRLANHYAPWQVVKRALRQILAADVGAEVIIDNEDYAMRGTLRRNARTIDYTTACGQEHRFSVAVIRKLEAWLE